MTQQRYIWLDSAKGISILSVMVCHAGGFVFYTEDTFVIKVIDSFFMSLFFLCSGFVSLKLFTSSGDRKYGVVLKDFSLLIPFIIFGLTYAYCLTGDVTVSGLLSKLFSDWSLGYWFLFTLFIFRISSILAAKATSAFKSGKYKWTVVLLSIIIVLTLGHYTNKWGFTVAYFPFFLLGALIKKYDLHTLLKRSMWVCPSMGIIAVIGFTIYHYSEYNIHPYVYIFGIRFFMTLTIFMGFVNSGGNTTLAKIGNYSLEIYCLHYFFMIGCKNILFPKDFLLQFPWAIQMLFMFVVATILTILSIVSAKCIKAIPNLHKILFGR